MMSPDWLTITEAAQAARVTRTTIIRWARAGHLTGDQHGITPDSLLTCKRDRKAARNTPRGITAGQPPTVLLSRQSG
jgi:hypothetical protein